jgi:hypothetical protein
MTPTFFQMGVRWRFAVIFLAVAGIGTAIFMQPFPRPAKQATVAVINGNASSPLGSLTYYEELAQHSVRIQFADIKTVPLGTMLDKRGDTALSICYQSPLFGDGNLLDAHYKTITGCRITEE